MTYRHRILALVLMAALGACAEPPDSQPTTQAERDAALRDSAFGGLVEPLEAAQELQQMQIDRKRELDEAIEN